MREASFRRRLSICCLAVVALVAAVSAAAEDTAVEGWPRALSASDASITVYQPEPEALDGDKLTGRVVVAVERTGESKPAYGSVWLECRIGADRSKRTVTLDEARVTKVRFPSAPEREADLTALLTTKLAGWSTVLSLDALASTLELAKVTVHPAVGLNHEAPKILYRDHPALLVSFDGAPVQREIEGPSVMRVVNTPFVVLIDGGTGLYYLFDGRYWLQADDLAGTWQVAQYPPTEVVELTPDDNAKQALETGQSPGTGYHVPEIIVATEPTELIVTTGPPQGERIDGTDLAAVANTESSLFFDESSKRYFVLLSGRWFASADLGGSWTGVAPDELPKSFAGIPPDSDHAAVLTFVAGTEQANDAVLAAAIPQTAAIQRDKTFAVSYEGPARFEPIDGTDMQYAVNTASSVVRAGDSYYCADSGVWYTAAAPEGPWAVAVELASEVDSIPPTSPLYNLTYLDIFGFDDREVRVGYYPGYSGTYVDRGTIVYGTGWTYRPWSGAAFFARPVTWGYQFGYWPSVGWRVGFSFDPGFYRYSVGYGRWDPCCFWGPGRGFGRLGPYDPRGPFYRPGAAYPRRALDSRGPLEARGLGDNNLFSDREGQVYRRSGSGWETRGGGGWGAVSAPEMDRQYAARSRGFATARGGGRRR